jgi:hypothetical protein
MTSPDGSTTGDGDSGLPEGSIGPGPDGGGGDDGGVMGPRLLDPCGPGDYCFAAPKPLGWDLGSVYVAAADDIWIAGGPGGIAHYDGKAWSQISLHSNSGFVLVPRAADDIWALAGLGPDAPQARHFDGQKWSTITLPMGQGIQSLAPIGPSDAWGIADVAQTPTLFHWDGQAWTQSSMAIPGYYASVVGSGPDNAWIYGDKAFYRLSGGSWQAVTPPPMPVAGSTNQLLPLGPNVAWFIESQNNYAWNGMSWASVTPAPSGGTYFGHSASDVWVPTSYSAQHWDGMTWSSVQIPGMNAVAAIDGSTTSVWAVGIYGSVSKLQGMGFVQQNAPITYAPTYRAVKAFADNDVVAVGDRGLAHWDGTSFTSGPDIGQNDWYGTDGTSSQDYFVVGATLVPDQTGIGLDDTYGTAAHITSGGQETILAMPSMTMPILRAIYVPAANNAWAVGDQGTIVHYDGNAWTFATGWSPDLTKGPFSSIAGHSASDIWAAGSGITAHYDGIAWTASTDSVAKLASYLCAGSGSVMWGGNTGSLISYDGMTWNAMYFPPSWPTTGDPTSLSRCAAGGAKDAWFTSTQGFVVHYDGTALSQELLYRGQVVDWVQGIGASPAGTLWLTFYGGELASREP